MEKHNLEEYFNKRFSEQEVFIDKNELYKNLGIEDDKKRRGAWWIWASGIIVFLGLAVAICLIGRQDNSLNLTTMNTDLEIEKAKHRPINISNQNESVILTRNAENETPNSKNTYNSYESSIVSESQTPLQKVTDPNSLRTYNNVASENAVHSQTKNVFHDSKIAKTKRNLEVTEDQGLLQKTNEGLSQGQIVKFQEGLGKYDKAVIVKDEIIFNKENISGPKNNDSTHFDLLVKADDTFLKDRSTLSNVFEIQKLYSEGIYFHRNIHFDLPYAQPLIKQNTSLSKLLSVGLFGDGAFVNRTLSLNNTLDTSATFLEARQLNETVLERLGFGGYLRIGKKQGLYGKLGAQYSSINSRLNATIYTNEKTTESDVPLTIIYTESGDTLFSNYGTLETNTKYKENWTIYNQQNVIDFALALGYQVQSNNWYGFVEMQPSISISHSFKGRIFDGLMFVEPETVFSTTRRFSILGSVGMGYYVTPKTSLWLQPYFQNTTQSFTKDAVDHRETYQFWGIKCGIDYRF